MAVIQIKDVIRIEPQILKSGGPKGTVRLTLYKGLSPHDPLDSFDMDVIEITFVEDAPIPKMIKITS